MNRPNVQLGEAIGLTVMLMMLAAFAAGRTDAQALEIAAKGRVEIPEISRDTFNANLEGRLGEAALKISIGVVTDLSQFRGEDE
jgi:hypothetical protein